MVWYTNRRVWIVAVVVLVIVISGSFYAGYRWGQKSLSPIPSENRTPVPLADNAGQLGQIVVTDPDAVVSHSTEIGDPIKDAVKNETVISVGSVRSRSLGHRESRSGKPSSVPDKRPPLKAPIALGGTGDPVPVGMAVYRYPENDLTTIIDDIFFQTNTVISEDEQGWKTYAELWLVTKDRRYPLSLDMENSHTEVRPWTPTVTLPKNHWIWWAPQAALGAGAAMTADSGIFMGIHPSMFFSAYGKTPIDSKWMIFGVSLDLGYEPFPPEEQDARTLVGMSFIPAAWRPLDAFITNTYLAPAVMYGNQSWGVGLRMILRF